MDLIKAVIHELVKKPAKNDSPEIPARVEFAPELLDTSDVPTTKLIESIQSIYGTKGNASSQGTFELDGSYSFPGQFSQFINAEITDSSFEELTKRCMYNLRNKAAEKNFATSGYIVFAYFRQNQQYFLLGVYGQSEVGFMATWSKPDLGSNELIDTSSLTLYLKSRAVVQNFYIHDSVSNCLH